MKQVQRKYNVNTIRYRNIPKSTISNRKKWKYNIKCRRIQYSTVDYNWLRWESRQSFNIHVVLSFCVHFFLWHIMLNFLENCLLHLVHSNMIVFSCLSLMCLARFPLLWKLFWQVGQSNSFFLPRGLLNWWWANSKCLAIFLLSTCFPHSSQVLFELPCFLFTLRNLLFSLKNLSLVTLYLQISFLCCR